MVIQILEQFKNRMEYRILGDFCDYIEVNLDALQNGILVLPGISLKKMGSDDLKKINQWIGNKDNQIILTPSWNELNLKDVFDLSIDVNIVNESSKFNDIPCSSYIQTTSKEKLYQNSGKVYAINHRNDISSGLITVVTLPLLDYKLIEYRDIFKDIFDKLLVVHRTVKEAKENVEENVLNIDDIHTSILILVSAGVKINPNIKCTINKYFKFLESTETILKKHKELIHHGFICNDEVSEVGVKFIKEKNLKAFINVIKERELNNDGWDEY